MSDWILQLDRKTPANQLPELTVFAHHRLALLQQFHHAASEAHALRDRQHSAALKETNKQAKLHQDAVTLLQQQQQTLKDTEKQVNRERVGAQTFAFAKLALPELKKELAAKEKSLVDLTSSSSDLDSLRARMSGFKQAKEACSAMWKELQELQAQLQLAEESSCRSCACNTVEKMVSQKRAAVKTACVAAATCDSKVGQDSWMLSSKQLPARIALVQERENAWQASTDSGNDEVATAEKSDRHQTYLQLKCLGTLVQSIEQQEEHLCELSISAAIRDATFPHGFAAKQLRRRVYKALTTLTNVILQQHFPTRPQIIIEESDDTGRVAVRACLHNGSRRSWQNCSQGKKNSMALGLSCALRRMMYQRLGFASSVIFLDEVFCHVDVAGFKVCLECVHKEAQRQVDFLRQPLTVYLIAHSSDVLPVLQEMGPHVQHVHAGPPAAVACRGRAFSESMKHRHCKLVQMHMSHIK